MLYRWYVLISKSINQTLRHFLNSCTAEKTKRKINCIYAVSIISKLNEWNKTVRVNKNQMLFKWHIEYRAYIYLSYDSLLLIEFISIQNFCRVSQSAKEFTLITHFDFDGCYVRRGYALIRKSVNQTLMYFLNSCIAKKTVVILITY